MEKGQLSTPLKKGKPPERKKIKRIPIKEFRKVGFLYVARLRKSKEAARRGLLGSVIQPIPK